MILDALREGTERAGPLMTGARSERLRVCCTALLAMLGVGTPNTTAAGVVLASDLVTMAFAYRNHGATW